MLPTQGNNKLVEIIICCIVFWHIIRPDFLALPHLKQILRSGKRTTTVCFLYRLRHTNTLGVNFTDIINYADPFRIASSETFRNPDGTTINEQFRYKYIVYQCAHYGKPRKRGRHSHLLNNK